MPTLTFKPRVARPSLRVVAALGLGLLILVGVLFIPPVYSAVGPVAVLWIYNVIAIALALFVVSLAGLIWWSAAPGEVLKTVAGSLSLGLLLWTLAGIVWAYDQLTLEGDLPDLSLADVFWLLGYIPMILGLYVRLHTFMINPRPSRKLILMSVHALLVVLALALVVRPILEHGDASRPLVTVINLLYVLGDLTMALLALLIVQALAQGAMFAPWVVLATGCLMVALSDLVLAYGAWTGTYSERAQFGATPVMILFNMTYLSSYVAGAIGAYWLARLHRVI